MTDDEFFEKLKNIKFKAPEWFALPIEEQIQYQVQKQREVDPSCKAIMCFTYQKDREPQIQRQVVEL